MEKADDLRFGPSTGFDGRLARLRWRRVLIPMAVAAVLALVGLAVHITVQRAMEATLGAKLKTILDADVTGLRIWLETQKKVVNTVVLEGEVRSKIRELVRLSESGDVAARDFEQNTALRALREILGPVCRTHGFADFLVIGPNGRILGAITRMYLGRRAELDNSHLLKSVFMGETVVSRPFRSALPVPDETGALREGLPTMFAAAPVKDEKGAVVAVLAFLIRPNRDFTRILSVGRPGKSGETYAFDAHGLMISQSRFDDHLKRIGLLDTRPEVHSMLNIEIRDPGGNLLKGYRPEPRDQQPLTMMASSATAGKSGINVKGYRDYRGVPVIGAWTWLDEYGFGVTTELDVAEAFRPLRVLRYAFGILFGLLMLATLGVLFSARIIAALHIRMERLGQYTLERKLGKGGMGAVYLARHSMLRRPTAVKILRREHSNEEAMARFEREVQITSQLTHLNTIRIYDYGRTPDGVFYYAMEYLPGVNLHSLIEKAGPLPEGRVIHILLQVCASLNEAHKVGLIHRDIKPENLIIYERGGDYDMVKVLDFGLVKYSAGRGSADVSGPELPAGTPQYLSPEAIQNPGQIDGRSDLYALAGVAYFLLTGEDMFSGKNPIELCRKQINEKPEPPSERLGRPISEDLENLILQCLEKDPARRPESAAALMESLEKCQDAGKWTQAMAKAWWDEIGDSLVQEELLSGEVPEVSESKMRVDLGRRAGAT